VTAAAAVPASQQMIVFEDVSKFYGEVLGVNRIDLRIAPGITSLVGPNGSGKTTLVQALIGMLEPESGTRWLGPGVRIGTLDQARAGFDGAGTLLDAFVEQSGMTLQDARSLLAKFGLEADEVNRVARSLSPGERTRASLALLMASGANFLVFDEPTNHLDLPAIEQLESALDAYEGTLLLVTHDRHLLEAVELDRSINLHVRTDDRGGVEGMSPHF
jgi:ATPase subunit of ABC transporter with duplicated ATPase domains